MEVPQCADFAQGIRSSPSRWRSAPGS